ncbi:ArsR/SmtB family transcription factor [Dietzia sp. SYD-A1]|uniref:ArsR/SmtB family transcription factor n=2 Tax=Dietzia TaxID=37914 RepID=UPI0035C803A3
MTGAGDGGGAMDLGGWAERFELLGDPTRLGLLAHMHQAGPGVATVSDLAAATGITRNAASQALRILRDRGWVTASRDPEDGRVVRYSLADDTVHRILHLMGARHH